MQAGQREDARCRVTSPGPRRMLIIPVLIMPSQADEHSSGPCPAPGAAKLDPLHGKTPGNGRFSMKSPQATEASCFCQIWVMLSAPPHLAKAPS